MASTECSGARFQVWFRHWFMSGDPNLPADLRLAPASWGGVALHIIRRRPPRPVRRYSAMVRG